MAWMGTAAGWDSAQYSIHTGELLAVAPAVAPVAIGFRDGQVVEVIVGGEWRQGRIYDGNEAEGTYDVERVLSLFSTRVLACLGTCVFTST